MNRQLVVILCIVGRAIAGITSANIAGASAYITDITPEDEREAQRLDEREAQRLDERGIRHRLHRWAVLVARACAREGDAAGTGSRRGALVPGVSGA